VQWFDYAAPTTLGEAVSILAAHPSARLLAGGTDLLVQMRARRKQTDLVVDAKRIPELSVLDYDPAAGLTLGAAVACYRVYESAAVRAAYPSLAEVASIIGGTAIQGRASIGGNLCNAAPSADAIPLLIALGATARIAGARGERTVAVEDFCTGPGKNCLEAGEVVVSLRIPPPGAGFGAHYLRFIPRNEMDIAVAGAGVSLRIAGGTITAARVALASVAPMPVFVKAAGDALVGKAPGREAFEAAGEAAKAAASPITDMRGTIAFRRHLCAVLTRRALEAVAAAQKGVQ
jgi:carbon-monoxide dehydrogenase medium subunit